MNCHEDLPPVRINKQRKNEKGMTGIGIAMLLVIVALVALVSAYIK